MKSLILAVAVALTAGCADAQDKSKSQPAAAPAVTTTAPAAAPAAPAAEQEKKSPETKRICVDVKDREGKPVKDAKGNVKQNCKEVKVHQKLEGTKVPEKK